MVQPFLTSGSLDLSARICVVAFSVAIPLLAALVLITRQEAFRRPATGSILVLLIPTIYVGAANDLCYIVITNVGKDNK